MGEPKLKCLYGLNEEQMYKVFEQVLCFSFEEQIFDHLEWHCEDCSDDYVMQVHNCFDLKEAVKNAYDMYIRGYSDLTQIRETAFDKAIYKAESQMSVKE